MARAGLGSPSSYFCPAHSWDYRSVALGLGSCEQSPGLALSKCLCFLRPWLHPSTGPVLPAKSLARSWLSNTVNSVGLVTGLCLTPPFPHPMCPRQESQQETLSLHPHQTLLGSFQTLRAILRDSAAAETQWEEGRSQTSFCGLALGVMEENTQLIGGELEAPGTLGWQAGFTAQFSAVFPAHHSLLNRPYHCCFQKQHSISECQLSPRTALLEQKQCPQSLRCQGKPPYLPSVSSMWASALVWLAQLSKG